ncbi:hypothetical protein Slin14017_G061580 [Septoria linicola]|nr:hypothetical protein Slin14017_G061580 [Septoria linicola]
MRPPIAAAILAFSASQVTSLPLRFPSGGTRATFAVCPLACGCHDFPTHPDFPSTAPEFDKREALSVAAIPDGSISPKSQEAIDRWNTQFGGSPPPSAEEKRDAVPEAMDQHPEEAGIPPETFEAYERWIEKMGGHRPTFEFFGGGRGGQ